MAKRAERGGSNPGYFLRFAGTATLLIAGTLILVLYVLPQRFVLSSGFREGGLSLPNPSTPFEPIDPIQIAALPAPPRLDGTVARGPAEIFWARVLPILREARYDDAIPLFTDYLAGYPGDLDVRREYALTLTAAGRADEAIPIFKALLQYEDDRALRLLLARTLRDERRLEEASVHYGVLADGDPDDEALVLEWARALGSVEDYRRAEEVLLAGLAQNPGSVPLRAELARTYYYSDRLEESDEILSGMTEAELASADALALRAGVRTALAPPPEPDVGPALPPPTLLELAVAAREDGDLERASSLFTEALAEHPDDLNAWQAYADFLQYEMEDFDGALLALVEVERLTGGGDSTLQYRMAQLEVWTDRTDEARARLEALLLLIDREAAAPGPPGDTRPGLKADALSLLGDLHRWGGRRLPAVSRYQMALVEDPAHADALAGLAILQADVDRMMIEVERPRLGATSSSFVDTDDFLRTDLGGEWYGLHEDWVWGTRAGGRLLDGRDLAGVKNDEQGIFADFAGARWSRWGTLRTELRLAVQNIRSNTVDVSAGASIRFMGAGGGRTDVHFDHEPAYALTNTLQSVLARVEQDRLVASHSRPLDGRWSLAITAEAASLNHRESAGSDRNLRIQGALSLGRSISRALTLGLSTRALHYANAAPDASGFALYWDPSSSLSVGPYAQYLRTLGTYWEVLARLTPGLALINERGGSGSETVPDLSANIAFTREGPRYRTALSLFHGQGRFDGYRSLGVDLSFSARGWLGRGGRQ